jgi:CBS domain-containing protein
LIPGLTGGLLAIAATALVYKSEDTFERLPVHWMWWPALGGLIIGIGGLIEPRALGVGYDVIDQLLTGNATASLILGVLVVKSLIWSMSLGSGTSGGVLAPVFMIGAALGAAEGTVLPAVSPGFWAMCGLAAVVGGVMRSPLTGIVFTLELTHAWNDLLPLVVASVAAYAVSVLLLKRSVLTEKIARRRLHLTREYTTDPLETFFAHEVMTEDPVVVCERDTVAAALSRVGQDGFCPVVDEAGRLAGVTTRRALIARAAGTVAGATIPATAVCFADDTLRDVANTLAAHEVSSAPVVDRTDPHRIHGVITVEQLLHARRRDLHEEHHRERVLTVRATPDDGRDVEDREAAAPAENQVGQRRHEAS